MTQFTQRTVSPFRYDIVGSFLRPQELKDARAKFAKGEISQADLTKVEDKCIVDLIHKEEQLGLHAVTDGEFRRSYWHLDFFWGLQGTKHVQLKHGYFFHDEETRNDSVQLTGKVSGENHPFVNYFKFVRDHVSDGTQVKQTIPAPAQFLEEFLRPENQANAKQFYPNQADLDHDVAQAYHQVIEDLYAAGCRTLQLDDCTWGISVNNFANLKKKDPNADTSQLEALQRRFLKVNNEAIADLPDDLVVNTHVCRGNYHSTWAAAGGYGPVADTLLARENVNAFYLEYDSDRAGGFEPLDKVPDDKYVVVGLVTSKSGELEDKQIIIDRLKEAAKYHPLNKLCLSPQCGFASTEEGNILTEEQQWNKLKFIKEIAEEVWG
ncbi:methionine synthase [Limosilactobacillus frumenti DSM 13145]|uniref:Methionine synthase n=1 Tax=Limosilactobacillus frumenti DSM 13145 TaxID=1423746 RepID=A0A0R1P557_9LACO|nr:5-methyltetrahydropteroyltriglutamate--homocysteine S-methyltransferase [Limosilactobacillus frumenti]KRL27776.1 methionine synthase [Limosilactobacillus frumenti DSM 13145]MBA2914410.1 5-methyltetrahydropteroyltriglutamate--homocysteine S-methyltransferase [Limosilactobacillus frumenti]QFG73331.1 5-methyltetrahydropteroyltriglutamate--homocysteine S-methyltransferase [Limosilactobacillus frumenti]